MSTLGLILLVFLILMLVGALPPGGTAATGEPFPVEGWGWSC